MAFIDIAKQRCSIRNYIAKKVEPEKLEQILEPVNILAIGYSNEKPSDSERHSKMRIAMDELIYQSF